MPLALLGLGANLGDRAATLNAAIGALDQRRATRVVRRSVFHETAPIGGPADQPAYLNAAVVVETQLAPEALLAELHTIEASLGRHRAVHWGPRTIDLDLLLYDDRVIDTPTLTVPHPRMSFRRFVLESAVEVAGDWVHPVSKTALSKLLANLQRTPTYIAIDGDLSRLGEPEASAPGVCSSDLATAVATSVDTRVISLPDPPGDVRMAISAGRALEVAVEFLATLRSLLDVSSCTDPQRPAISDFWIERVRQQMESWLTTNERAEFEREWRRVRDDFMSPKLLILLPDAPLPTFQGATLRLKDNDTAAQCGEITAAIEAMR
jgi:2-amino-4-hydroxy-6-hydroxymethyldihydropteridine diphosphokinase